MSENALPEQSLSPVSTVAWTEGVERLDGYKVEIEIERTDADEVGLLTAIDGHGSELSFYWSTRQAVEVARRLLNAAAKDWRS